MPDLRRRDFLGLLAAVASCGLPVPTQSALPAPVVPTLPEPKKPAPVATRGESAPAGREDWVRACLGDAIAIDVMREVSVSGLDVTRIIYIKREPGAAERCAFTKERARAEKGRMRACWMERREALDLLDISSGRDTHRHLHTPQLEDRLTIEWIA